MRNLMLVIWLVLLGVVIGWLGQAPAQEEGGPTPPVNAPELSIPAVNRGGVRNWVAEDDSTLFVQDNFRKWYRVRLHVPARQLLFTEGIAFITGPSGSLDNTSQIVVRGQKYPVASVTAGEGPKRQRR